MTPTPRQSAPDELPTRPDHASDDEPHEVENPGDPGPTVLVPSKTDDPRKDPRLPDQGEVPPGI